MKVHYGDDKQNVASHLIDDSIGEPIRTAAASSFGEGRPGLRVLEDSFERLFDFLSELRAETPALVNRNSRWPLTVRTGRLPET